MTMTTKSTTTDDKTAKVTAAFLTALMRGDITSAEIDRLRADLGKEIQIGERLIGYPEAKIWERTNEGQINMAADPERAFCENITNAFDALIAENMERIGFTHLNCPWKSPREALLSLSNNVGYQMLPAHQQAHIRNLVRIRGYSSGRATSDGQKRWRNIEVRDRGVGILPENAETTILSLARTNKGRAYMFGRFCQGRATTFCFSKYTLIVSRHHTSDQLFFTLVYHRPGPIEMPDGSFTDNGNYVYLTINDAVPSVAAKDVICQEMHNGVDQPTIFQHGTLIRHIDYNDGKFSTSSGTGRGSFWSVLNRYMFGTPMPFTVIYSNPDDKGKIKFDTVYGVATRLDSIPVGQAQKKGTAVLWKGAARGTQIGQAGSLDIEYFLLAPSEEFLESKRHDKKENKLTGAFVEPTTPVVFTINGQNQGEATSLVFDKLYPYLKGTFIAHINCNDLTQDAKRKLFVSNRESFRKNAIYDDIIAAFREFIAGEAPLQDFNEAARTASIAKQDEVLLAKVKDRIKRLLNPSPTMVDGGSAGGGENGVGGQGANGSSGKGAKWEPIEPRNPPTFVRFRQKDKNAPFRLEIGKAHYLQIETDATANYLRRMGDVVVRDTTGIKLKIEPATSWSKGRARVRVIIEPAVIVGDGGSLTIDLKGVIGDHKPFVIVKPPVLTDRKVENKKHQGGDKGQQGGSKQSAVMPDITINAVTGPEEFEKWQVIASDDDIKTAAFGAILEQETNPPRFMLNYSTVFPPFAAQYALLVRTKGASAAEEFGHRYATILAEHAYLMKAERALAERTMKTGDAEDMEQQGEIADRREACRAARTVISMLKMMDEVATNPDAI